MRQFLVSCIFLSLLTACATSGQVGLIDFNTAFHENVPTNPQYKIELVGVNRFQLVVYQGAALISERTTRVSFLNKAALIAMESHCITLGGILGEHTLRDGVDSLGYINVLGYFACKSLAIPSEPPSKDKRKNTEI